MTTLTALQRAQIARVLTARGFDHTLFRWELISGQAIGSVGHEEPCLRFAGSEFTFSSYQGPSSEWYVVFAPGENQSRSSVGPLAWEGVLLHLEMWAAILHEESSAVDPWALTAHIGQPPEPPGALVNSQFTGEEREAVSRSLDEVLTELRSHTAYSAEQFNIIQQQFAEMREASERVGKKDWAAMALGTVISTAASAALDPIQSRRLWSVFSSSLSWLTSMPLLRP